MREGFKEDLPGQALHFFESLLDLPPVCDGLAQPLVLLLREGHAHRFAFDLACPLITRPARPGTAILDIALADPADLSQVLFEVIILFLSLLELRIHTEKSSRAVNRAVYIPPL